MRFYLIIVLFIIFSSCEKRFIKEDINNPEFVFESYWKEIDRNYSFFTYSFLNWDSVYSAHRNKVNTNTSETELLQVLTEMTDLLNDAHTNIFTQKGVFGNTNYFEKFPLNQVGSIDNYINIIGTDRIFNYGLLKSYNYGYIQIKTFEGEQPSFMQFGTVLSNFNDCDAIIIDIRSNRGGLVSNSLKIASYFIEKGKYVCSYRTRNGRNHDDFSDWKEVHISPSKGSQFCKRVILLTNKRTYSAAEWFVLSLKGLSNVTIVGDTTGGGSAITLSRELTNGWILRVSNTQLLMPSGGDFQFVGITPDYPVLINNDEYSYNKDVILECAITVLNRILK